MIKFSSLLLIVLLISTKLFAGLDQELASRFLDALMNNSEFLNQFIDHEELRLTSRLNISYKDVDRKFFIANDFDERIKVKVREGSSKVNFIIEKMDSIYSKLKVQVFPESESREYYFRNSKLISNAAYFGKNWKKSESEYFVFHFSDELLTNEYAMKQLDDFIEHMSDIMDFSETERLKLANEKIHYFLCKDKSEIKNITGYEARGMYLLANDFIVSTFNCHYHEIVHLLINYKLRSLELYTLPILQEGFAVAYGGRGGKEPNVILEMGKFLIESGFMDYTSILTKSDFYKHDASMTYPVAGQMVKQLIDTKGFSSFLEIYKSYSGILDIVDSFSPGSEILPKLSAFKKYLSEQRNSFIQIDDINENSFPLDIYDSQHLVIKANDESYLFSLKNSLAIIPQQKLPSYKSVLAKSILPSDSYEGEKYFISASSNEVSVYNFYTNNLIAKYVKNFSTERKAVVKKNGYYKFALAKELFDEELNQQTFVVYDVEN